VVCKSFGGELLVMSIDEFFRRFKINEEHWKVVLR
jgi:hypothetical protein